MTEQDLSQHEFVEGEEACAAASSIHRGLGFHDDCDGQADCEVYQGMIDAFWCGVRMMSAERDALAQEVERLRRERRAFLDETGFASLEGAAEADSTLSNMLVAAQAERDAYATLYETCCRERDAGERMRETDSTSSEDAAERTTP